MNTITKTDHVSGDNAGNAVEKTDAPVEETVYAYMVDNRELTWIALLVTGFAAGLFLFGNDQDIVYQWFAVSTIISAILLWAYRYSRITFWWVPRLFSLSAIMVAYYLLIDHWRFPLEISESTKDGGLCPAGKDTLDFVPLLGFAILGGMALSYSLWGGAFSYSEAVRQKKPESSSWLLLIKRIVWWLLYIPGIYIGARVLIDSYSWEALIETGKGGGYILLAIGGFFLAIAAIIFIASIPSMRHKKVMLADYAALSDTQRSKIRTLYQQFVSNTQCRNSYRILAEEDFPEDSAVAESHLGGKPYAVEGESWPCADNQNDSRFLVQLLLSDPMLPDIWRGRLIVVFLVDWEVVVRSYQDADKSRAVDISSGHGLFSGRLIHAERVPYAPLPDEDDEDAWDDYCPGYSAEYAFNKDKGLKKYVGSLSKYPVMLLDHLLSEEGYPNDDRFDMINEAGAPYLIQNPHDPKCPECGNDMRFLFEFGEILEDQDFTLGDAAMCYIYGCDQHPEHCLGFVDTH